MSVIAPVIELPAPLHAQAVRVLAGAFLHDPAWVAIGPRREPSRRRLLERYYTILIGEGLRWGGPNWCVIDDGSVVGVALTYADGLGFPPPRATLREAPPFLLAGPAPGLRGAWVDAVMKRHHPRDEYLFLWYLAADPSRQRQGIGRTLLDHVREEARRRGDRSIWTRRIPRTSPITSRTGIAGSARRGCCAGRRSGSCTTTRPPGAHPCPYDHGHDCD